MTLHSASWLPLIVLAMLAALAYRLNQLASEPLPESDAAFRHDPDLIVDNFVVTAFDPAGHARYVLAAAKMQYYADDETTRLVAPHVRIQPVDAPVIRAEAARGFISTQGEHVYLIDRVRLSRSASADMPELVLTTDYLQITPEAQRLRTDKPVHIQQGGSSLVAASLVLDAQARSMELRGGVRGIYAPR